MKHKYLFITALVALFAFTSCNKDELLLFDAGDRVNFMVHEQALSFLGKTTAELPADTLITDITIVGHTAPFDRTVAGVAYEDPAGTPDDKKLTTATKEDYQILGGIIPAGSTFGTFKVLCINRESLGTQTMKLRVLFAENEYFKPGTKENLYIDLSWSRNLMKPKTWSAFQTYVCATYSTAMYKIFIEVTGLSELEFSNVAEAAVIGKKFGDYVRAYNIAHPGAPLCHDDGDEAGSPIIPLM